MPHQPHRLLALIFPTFEHLDLFGPLGLLLPRSVAFSCVIAGLDGPGAYESSMGNQILTQTTVGVDEALRGEVEFDTLVIPGGMGTRRLLDQPDVLQKIGQLAERAKWVFTVCTGSVLLAGTGRLDGVRATTNKRAFDQLTPRYPSVNWVHRARFVRDGKYFTTSGVTAGLDGALAFASIIESGIQPDARDADKWGDRTASRRNAWGIEYRWNEDAEADEFADGFPEELKE